jgi:hypothetical protein
VTTVGLWGHKPITELGCFYSDTNQADTELTGWIGN